MRFLHALSMTRSFRSSLGILLLLLGWLLAGAAASRAQEPSPDVRAVLCEEYAATTAAGEAFSTTQDVSDPDVLLEILQGCALDIVQSGEVTVWDDPFNGFTCIQSQRGRSRGSGCALYDTTDPMVVATGPRAGGPVVVMTVDPQERLLRAEYFLEGEFVPSESLEVVGGSPGMAIADELGVWPDTVVLFDSGNEEFWVIDAVSAIAEDEASMEEGNVEPR